MKNILYSFLIAFALLLTGCANAGKDQQVNANTLVTLNGNASTPSAKGQITTYKWKQIKGKKVRLSNKKTASPTFTAPNVNKKKKLVFRLTTTETGGIYSPLKTRDYVVITVLPTTTTDVDTVKPVLALNGDANITLTVGDTYVDAGATATDNKDGDITDAIVVDNPVDTTTEGTYTITYTVSDAVGNETTATRTVTVVLPADTTAPVITLIGGDVTLTVGETYTEQGASATDDRDGNVTVDINGTVNTTTAGIYTIVYTASDLAGNQASPVTRTVTVNALTNHAPTANDLSVTTSKNTSLDINVTVEDSDGDTLMYNLHTMPDHGTLTGELPNVTYHPNAEYVGTDYFTFSAMDGHLAESTEANISIAITNNIINMHTLRGKVTDINGTGITGAQVTIAGTTISTDINGSYTLSNIVASERVHVDVSHPEYLKNSRIVSVETENIRQNITLEKPKATLTFDSTEGAIVTQNNGAKVELPAGEYIDVNGTSYTGVVTVRIGYSPITTLRGIATLPGTYEGIDSNDTFPIQSYGFMNIELSDPQGNTLNLNGSSTATLTYPMDSTISSPTTIPLWYYDEVQGYWVKEGEATLVDSTYIGTVTHFTAWSLADAKPKTKIGACIQDQDGNPVSGALIQLEGKKYNGIVTSLAAMGRTTDQNGWSFSDNILGTGVYTTDLTIIGSKIINGLRYTGKSSEAYHFVAGEDKNITNCIVIKKPTNNAHEIDYSKTITVTGRLYKATSCSGQTPPVLSPNATLNIYDNTRYENDYRLHLLGTTKSDSNGDFSLSFHPNHSQSYRINNLKTINLEINKTNYNVGSLYIPLCT